METKKKMETDEAEENTMFREIDFVELMQNKRARELKVKELLREARKEVEEIDSRYSAVLGEYRVESQKIQKIVDDFNTEWEPKLAGHKKEMKACKAKWKKISKSLE